MKWHFINMLFFNTVEFHCSGDTFLNLLRHMRQYGCKTEYECTTYMII